VYKHHKELEPAFKIALYRPRLVSSFFLDCQVGLKEPFAGYDNTLLFQEEPPMKDNWFAITDLSHKIRDGARKMIRLTDA